MGILNLFIDKNAHVQVVPFLFFFFFLLSYARCLFFLSFFSWAIGVIVVLFCFVFFLFFLFCLTRHDFFGYDFYFLINLGDCFFLGGLFATFLF